MDILRATIKHKARFMHLVDRSEVLRLVPLPEWAGMGGVRFVPEGWESLLTDQAKTELNKLNIDLVEALKSTDNAFSLGEGTDGLICVRFGMVTHETEVEELLDLVVTVGKSVQENSRVLDTMSEIVKKVKAKHKSHIIWLFVKRSGCRASRQLQRTCSASPRRSCGRRAYCATCRLWVASSTGGRRPPRSRASRGAAST